MCILLIIIIIVVCLAKFFTVIFITKIIAQPSKLASISIRVFPDAGYCVFDSQKRAWDPLKLSCASFGLVIICEEVKKE